LIELTVTGGADKACCGRWPGADTMMTLTGAAGCRDLVWQAGHAMGRRQVASVMRERLDFPGDFYHALACGNCWTAIFHDDADYRS